MKKTLVAILVYQSLMLLSLLIPGTAVLIAALLFVPFCVPFFVLFLIGLYFRVCSLRGPEWGMRDWKCERAKLPPGGILGGPWRWLPRHHLDPNAPEAEWQEAKREYWQITLAALLALGTAALGTLVAALIAVRG